MKKVLFTTTALIASAGFASAQGVSLSGSAVLGIWGGDDVETQFFTDIDVTFSMSGETDNGLTFGANVDLDESDGDPSGAFGGLTQGGEVVYLKGAFGNINAGDTDGALDWAMQEAIIGGTVGDVNEHAGYNGNAGLDGASDGATGDGQVVRYDYSFGDFAFAVSAEIDTDAGDDNIFGVGGKYSGDLGGVTLGVGIGYQSNSDVDLMGISLDVASDNGLRAIVNYTDSGDADVTHTGLAVGYTMDALTVAVNWGVYDTPAGDTEGTALTVNYDLGGGAELQAGYAANDILGVDANRFSLGVAMSF